MFFSFIDSKDELTWIDDWLKIMNIIFNQIFYEGGIELILKLNDPVTFSLTFTLLFQNSDPIIVNWTLSRMHELDFRKCF